MGYLECQVGNLDFFSASSKLPVVQKIMTVG